MEEKILVTAGNTAVPIDKVRSITNVFLGTTGTLIAMYLSNLGYKVTLLTSSEHLIYLSKLTIIPDYLQDFNRQANEYPYKPENLKVIPFITYDDLYKNMEQQICTGSFDAVIHSAAVSDYKVAGLAIINNNKLVKLDNSSKVSSNYQDLYLHLVPTEKIIDKIRNEWGFTGRLVKFKLQSGISDKELIKIATQSMLHSKADMIVANCKEWHKKYAYLIENNNKRPFKVERENLSYFIGRRLFP